uniref:Exonuclease domain-containing protein n=1 Tax=viral metagenome TaxID=1070528 RepID=A0A6C0EG83_9ZZZZ
MSDVEKIICDFVPKEYLEKSLEIAKFAHELSNDNNAYYVALLCEYALNVEKHVVKNFLKKNVKDAKKIFIWTYQVLSNLQGDETITDYLVDCVCDAYRIYELKHGNTEELLKYITDKIRTEKGKIIALEYHNNLIDLLKLPNKKLTVGDVIDDEYYICILDFEATCDDKHSFPNEVIEFPSVMIKVKNGKTERLGEFQEYCLPKNNKKLTKFCTDLTGITQEQVDAGKSFPDVFELHYEWIKKMTNNNTRYMTFVTCGDWDLMQMAKMEYKNWNLTPPKEYLRYINIKAMYTEHYNKKAGGMYGMLMEMGLTLDGRHHSGLDDSRNIGKIFEKLIELGYKPNIEKLTRYVKLT